MNRTIYVLSGLFVAQLALAVGLNVSSAGFAGEVASKPLLPAKPDDVKALSITGKDGKAVHLARGDAGWVLPDQGNFPADSDKVGALLSDLAKAEEGAPVATSAGAEARFHVDKAGFQRKLVIGPEKSPVATIYLGDMQGTRQIYVREDGQTGVRTADFSLYKAPDGVGDWLDAQALDVNISKLESLSWGGVKLIRQAGLEKNAPKDESGSVDKSGGEKSVKTATVWQVERGGGAPQSLADADAVKITGALNGLTVTGFAAKDALPDAAAKPALDLAVALQGGKSEEYKLYAAKADSFVVEASNLPQPVTVTSFSAQALVKATQDPALTGIQPVPSAPSAPANAAAPGASASGAAAPAAPATPSPDAAAPAAGRASGGTGTASDSGS